MLFTENIRSWARRIKRDAVTLWFAYKHPKTPFFAKALCVFVVAYALSPIDLIPDFIPILGYVDDVLLLPSLIWVAVKLVPVDVLKECRTQSDVWMEREGRKPLNYWGAVFVICLWISASWAIWKFVIVPRI